MRHILQAAPDLLLLTAITLAAGMIGGCDPTGLPTVPHRHASTALTVRPDTIVHSGTASTAETEGTISISFTMPVAGRARLALYTSDDRLVAVLLDEYMDAGNNMVDFNGDNLASGLYVYVLSVNGVSTAHKMVLVK